MTINDAIHNLESYGRHMFGHYICINVDRSVELLLKNSVIVLEDAGMIERDKNPKYTHCNVRIINKPESKIDYTKGL